MNHPLLIASLLALAAFGLWLALRRRRAQRDERGWRDRLVEWWIRGE